MLFFCFKVCLLFFCGINRIDTQTVDAVDIIFKYIRFYVHFTEIISYLEIKRFCKEKVYQNSL